MRSWSPGPRRWRKRRLPRNVLGRRAWLGAGGADVPRRSIHGHPRHYDLAGLMLSASSSCMASSSSTPGRLPHWMQPRHEWIQPSQCLLAMMMKAAAGKCSRLASRWHGVEVAPPESGSTARQGWALTAFGVCRRHDAPAQTHTEPCQLKRSGSFGTMEASYRM